MMHHFFRKAEAPAAQQPAAGSAAAPDYSNLAQTLRSGQWEDARTLLEQHAEAALDAHGNLPDAKRRLELLAERVNLSLIQGIPAQALQDALGAVDHAAGVLPHDAIPAYVALLRVRCALAIPSCILARC